MLAKNLCCGTEQVKPVTRAKHTAELVAVRPCGWRTLTPLLLPHAHTPVKVL
jgi:hypothetical protein